MRGRKPIPVELKLLRGNPGRKRIKKTIKSDTPISASPPGWFDELAKKEWVRVVKLYALSGMLTEGDRPMLEQYCIAYSTWRQIMTHAKLTMIKTATGYPVINPWIGTATKVMKELKSLASEFGFSPAARSRIGRAEATPENEFDNFLNREK